ncbi:MAG: DUF2249 domain-containing protein [Gammaproteobacteria bacterium]|nr:DUF2249 domain-containing protein [Gammaproteobacteria bacterium]
MGETLTVDARDLPAPEPLERVLEALAGLRGTDRLRLLIHREPLPLYDILRSGGYRWDSRALADGSYQVLIWQDA